MGILSGITRALGGSRRRPTIGANTYGRRRSSGAGGALLGTLGGLALRELSRRSSGGTARGYGGQAGYGRTTGGYGRTSGGLGGLLGGLGGMGAGRSSSRGGGLLGGLLSGPMNSRSGRRTTGGRF